MIRIVLAVCCCCSSVDIVVVVVGVGVVVAIATNDVVVHDYYPYQTYLLICTYFLTSTLVVIIVDRPTEYDPVERDAPLPFVSSLYECHTIDLPHE